ncbi:MAG: hypothetical protein WCP97_04565 [bacterium]
MIVLTRESFERGRVHEVCEPTHKNAPARTRLENNLTLENTFNQFEKSHLEGKIPGLTTETALALSKRIMVIINTARSISLKESIPQQRWETVTEALVFFAKRNTKEQPEESNKKAATAKALVEYLRLANTPHDEREGFVTKTVKLLLNLPDIAKALISTAGASTLYAMQEQGGWLKAADSVPKDVATFGIAIAFFGTLAIRTHLLNEKSKNLINTFEAAYSTNQNRLIAPLSAMLTTVRSQSVPETFIDDCIHTTLRGFDNENWGASEEYPFFNAAMTKLLAAEESRARTELNKLSPLKKKTDLLLRGMYLAGSMTLLNGVIWEIAYNLTKSPELALPLAGITVGISTLADPGIQELVRRTENYASDRINSFLHWSSKTYERFTDGKNALEQKLRNEASFLAICGKAVLNWL